MPHIALFTNGSRGDFQPVLALARALQHAGHTVTLAGPRNDSATAARCDVPYAAYDLDFQALATAPESRRALRRGTPFDLLGAFVRLERDHGDNVRQTIRRAAAGADVLVAHYLLLNWAVPLAEALGCPLVPVNFMPLTPATSVRPNILLAPDHSFGSVVNRLTHTTGDVTWWLANRGRVQAWRRELGLGPARESTPAWLHRARPTFLHGYSPVLAPAPPDWGPENVLTGAWTPDAATRALLFPPSDESDALQRWLDERPNEAPVYLGFGSLPLLDPGAVTAYSQALARHLGRRVLIGSGWSDLPTGRVHDGLFVARSVDHEAILPRCAAVVHHGGSGTTHAALRAGRPAVVCAVFADQLFWGRAVERAGAGVRLLYRKLTPEKLAAAVEAVLKDGVVRRAMELGAVLREEAGAVGAVDVLEGILAQRRFSACSDSGG